MSKWLFVHVIEKPASKDFAYLNNMEGQVGVRQKILCGKGIGSFVIELICVNPLCT